MSKRAVNSERGRECCVMPCTRRQPGGNQTGGEHSSASNSGTTTKSTMPTLIQQWWAVEGWVGQVAARQAGMKEEMGRGTACTECPRYGPTSVREAVGIPEVSSTHRRECLAYTGVAIVVLQASRLNAFCFRRPARLSDPRYRPAAGATNRIERQRTRHPEE